MNLYEVTTL